MLNKEVFTSTNTLLRSAILYTNVIALLVLFKFISAEQCLFSHIELLLISVALYVLYTCLRKLLGLYHFTIQCFHYMYNFVNKNANSLKVFLELLLGADNILRSMIVFSYSSCIMLYFRLLSPDQYISMQFLIIILYSSAYVIKCSFLGDQVVVPAKPPLNVDFKFLYE